MATQAGIFTLYKNSHPAHPHVHINLMYCVIVGIVFSRAWYRKSFKLRIQRAARKYTFPGRRLFLFSFFLLWCDVRDAHEREFSYFPDININENMCLRNNHVLNYACKIFLNVFYSFFARVSHCAYLKKWVVLIFFLSILRVKIQND